MNKRDLEKIETLRRRLKKYRKVLIAYSGGADSTFLLKEALETIGRENVLAVTRRSALLPTREFEEAAGTARALGADHRFTESRILRNKDFTRNTPERCYYCKKELFSKLSKIACAEGYFHILDGTNCDDAKDIRCGNVAAKERGVKQPLLSARIDKRLVREASRKMGLVTWGKRSFSCLISRLPYYCKIDLKELDRIDKAELFLYNKGFKVARVRSHGSLARIEVKYDEIKRAAAGKGLRQSIAAGLKSLGYAFVTVDLEGYRPGSMDKTGRKPRRRRC